MTAPIFARKLAKARKELLQNLVNKEYLLSEKSPANSLGSYSPVANSPSVLRKQDSLKYVGSDKVGVISVSIKSPDLIYKTGVDYDCKVHVLIEKMEKKLPPSLTGYSLWLNNIELEEDKSIGHYKDASNRMELEIKPIKILKTQPSRKNSLSKTFSGKAKKVYEVAIPEEATSYGSTTGSNNSNPSSPKSAPMLQYTTSSVLIKSSQSIATKPLEPSTKAQESIEVIAVTVKTPTMTISTKVPSISKLSELQEKMKAKYPSDDFKLYFGKSELQATMLIFLFSPTKDGKLVNLDKTLNDYRKDTDQKSVREICNSLLMLFVDGL
jgi:hypothetical protein